MVMTGDLKWDINIEWLIFKQRLKIVIIKNNYVCPKMLGISNFVNYPNHILRYFNDILISNILQIVTRFV